MGKTIEYEEDNNEPLDLSDDNLDFEEEKKIEIKPVQAIAVQPISNKPQIQSKPSSKKTQTPVKKEEQKEEVQAEPETTEADFAQYIIDKIKEFEGRIVRIESRLFQIQ